MTRDLIPREIRKTARATLKALSEYDLEGCLFGSAACMIYGMDNRVPNDVDIIVMTDEYTEEQIKEMIIASDGNFFLIEGQGGPYNVLWYSLPGPPWGKRRCKVDILLPGNRNLSLPDKIPYHRILRLDRFPDLPVLPIIPLLLLKLRGWTDHRTHHKGYMQKKVPQDVVDIHELLEIAINEYGKKLFNEGWLPGWFKDEAYVRVSKFVKKFPGTRSDWVELGFDHVDNN